MGCSSGALFGRAGSALNSFCTQQGVGPQGKKQSGGVQELLTLCSGHGWINSGKRQQWDSL